MSEEYEFYIVGPEAVSEATAEGGVAQIPGSGTQLQSLQLRHLFFGEKKVSSEKLMESWEGTKKVIAAILVDVQADKPGGITLDEVEVSLAISGKGSIGLVTAGAEAGIKLKFKKK